MGLILMINQTDIDKFRELEAKATPGPWSAADEHSLIEGATPAWCVSRDTADGGKWMYDVCYVESGIAFEEADAELIAVMRNVLPELLDALEKVLNG